MIKFRDSHSYKEILKAFKAMKKNNEKLLLWQRHQVPRLKCEVKIEQINVHSGTITFSPIHNYDDFFDFTSKAPLFVKSKYRELLFIVEERKWTEGVDKIIINVPGSVKMIELREAVRKTIDPDQYFTVKILKLTHRGSKVFHNDFNMRVINISSGGACIQVSNANKSFFKEGDRFQIVETGQGKLPQALESEVIYSVESDTIGYWKMGIQFKRKVEKIELGSIFEF